MSFSNPRLKNPATRFFQWKGGAEAFKEGKETVYEGGKLTYYDKDAGVNVEVELPFSFVVLDQLTTLTGYNDTRKVGYYSNEVRDSNGILVARSKEGVVARGTYQDIKSQAITGLKYAQSVYIIYKDEQGEFAIGNIKMSGAAMSAWIDFTSKFDIEKCAVYITDEPKLAKKGSNHYFVPVFEGQELSEGAKDTARSLDIELQGYLNKYMERRPDENEEVLEEVDDEDLPADNGKATDDDAEIEDTDIKVEAPTDDAPAAKKPAPKKKADNDKIKLSDVPF